MQDFCILCFQFCHSLRVDKFSRFRRLTFLLDRFCRICCIHHYSWFQIFVIAHAESVYSSTTPRCTISQLGLSYLRICYPKPNSSFSYDRHCSHHIFSHIHILHASHSVRVCASHLVKALCHYPIFYISLQ